ncbi:LysR family transcriptional regulator [Arenibacterium sp. CAU 1754]
MSRNLNLNAFVYFEAVARRGSLSRAAEELSVSPSAVSQQIKLLEQQMGIKLFRRDGRQLSLTLEGEQLFQTSSTALRMLQEVRSNLGKTHETRRLNLRVTPSFGVRWLGPRLSGFVRTHPDWDLRVDAAPDPTDFDREVMDLDIRYGAGHWSGYYVQPVVKDHVLPLCNPDYLRGLQSAETLDEVFDRARLIDSARAMCQWDYWLYRNGISTGANRKSILMDRSSMSLQLALDGAGVVLESLALAQAEVSKGNLVPVTPGLPIVGFDAYWVICPPRYLNRRAVRLFLNWLEGQAEAHRKSVEQITRLHGMSIDEIDVDRELTRGTG